MQQRMPCILLTCLVFITGLIISSAVVHSETYTKVDAQTGRYLDSLGASQHRQTSTSVNYHFEQHGSQYSKDSLNYRNSPLGEHGSQYSKDSMNKRNNPVRYDRVIINPFVGQKRVYLQDSMNKRNNPGGKYYVPQKLNHPASNVTGPHETAVTIQIKDW